MNYRHNRPPADPLGRSAMGLYWIHLKYRKSKHSAAIPPSVPPLENVPSVNPSGTTCLLLVAKLAPSVSVSQRVAQKVLFLEFINMSLLQWIHLFVRNLLVLSEYPICLHTGLVTSMRSQSMYNTDVVDIRNPGGGVRAIDVDLGSSENGMAEAVEETHITIVC